jgi:hypothetical protein
MKTDEEIKSIVSASIRRHSRELSTWVLTRLWDAGDPYIKEELQRWTQLTADEQPIVYSCCDPKNWTLVTTRRVWYCDEGHVGSIAVPDIASSEYGNFKGTAEQMVERMVLTSHEGVVHRCPYETGKPAMATVYAVRTLLQLR